MGVAYFVRGAGVNWAVIKLQPDDREEVLQDGLTLIEAEILCAMKLEDQRSRTAESADEAATAVEEPRRKRARQLTLKF